MKSNHWIEAHVHAYSFFGGVTHILVPDNLKTGVIKNTRTELILNRTVGDCRYSVPYEFIGKKVDIRTTENSIEIFYHNHRIASHVRKMYSAEPVYIPEHMPENHRRFLEYNTESFLDWGKNMGHSTLLVVKHFLYMHKVEQQGYKSCASLMKLADRYGTERLENACAKALSYTPSPSLKNISTILKNGQDKVALTTDPVRASSKESSKYGITRGVSYYGGGDHS